MGFFDNYQDEGGLNYVDQEEKQALIKNDTPLTVLRVFTGEGQYGAKYNMVVELDGEERCISFGAGKVESRDRMFDAMIEYLDVEEDDKDPEWTNPVVKLVKVKQSILVRNAES